MPAKDDMPSDETTAHFTTRAVEYLSQWDRRFLAGLLALLALASSVMGVFVTRDSDASWGTAVSFLLIAGFLQGASVWLSSTFKRDEVDAAAVGATAVALLNAAGRQIVICTVRLSHSRSTVEEMASSNPPSDRELGELSVALSMIEEQLVESTEALSNVLGAGSAVAPRRRRPHEEENHEEVLSTEAEPDVS